MCPATHPTRENPSAATTAKTAATEKPARTSFFFRAIFASAQENCIFKEKSEALAAIFMYYVKSVLPKSVLAPAGRSRIAPRFIAGLEEGPLPSPGGTNEISTVPDGTGRWCGSSPQE